MLFAQLSEYRPYPPPRLGWQLKLVAGPEATIASSADEVFDASRQHVVNSARRFYQSHQWACAEMAIIGPFWIPPAVLGPIPWLKSSVHWAQKTAKVETPTADR